MQEPQLKALTNSTIDYAKEIANKGWKQACKDNKSIKKGLNVVKGELTNKNVAQAFSMDYYNFEDLV